MNIKTKIILGEIIKLVLAATFMLMGYGKNDEVFSIGIVILVIIVVRLPMNIRLLCNEEKLKAFQIASKDERNVYISNKSYAMAFWISVLAEWVAFMVMMFLNIKEHTFLAYIICIQLLLYVIIRMIYNRKY